MQENDSTCIDGVGGVLQCPFCKGLGIIKYGKTKQGKQRYSCKGCNKSFIGAYTRLSYLPQIDNKVSQFLKEGCGIRSISRLLAIAASTVMRKILQMSRRVTKPPIYIGKEYELDEICTYIRNKNRKRWIVYAIRKDTRQVVDFSIGNRTIITLSRVTATLLLSEASQVYTDKLIHYRSLLPPTIHNTRRFGTNYIERLNLTIRTDLKRLSRKTICFSRSVAMLSACLRIYFWG